MANDICPTQRKRPCSFRKPPVKTDHYTNFRLTDIKDIKALESISTVQQNGEKLILHCSAIEAPDNLQHNPQQNPEMNPSAIIRTSQQLIALASQRQWGLYEIYPEKQTLEDVFMSLTCDETSESVQEQEQKID